jgi:adenine-specific DNA-methyltransferase
VAVRKSRPITSRATREASSYRHPEAELPLRPEVGTQPQFKKRKPPVTYRYDSSLSPALEWDGQNHAREAGEALIREILDAETLQDAKAAAERLKAMSGPFLNWAGKAERLSFEVPTLPLFVHERLSTKGIIETLKGHKIQPDLFGDPQHPIADQVLKAYEYHDKWVNRMILGDSLVVMNSLLHYEGLGGQVQMIYIDPPYGVRFGSNFQPFVRKRDVVHNDDEDMTREPEMVKSYRDTWELGLHSYLTYLRDRLLLARELLSPSGSVFVQIGDENIHHVRELMDETLGPGARVGIVSVVKTSAQEDALLPAVCDFILWYCKDRERLKYRPLWIPKVASDAGVSEYNGVQLVDGTRRRMSTQEEDDWARLPQGSRPYRQDNMVSQRPPGDFPVEFEGATYRPLTGYWKLVSREWLNSLARGE